MREFRFLRCREEGCQLRRWHRSPHYRGWENGVWQMWTGDADFGYLSGNHNEPGVPMQTITPIAGPNA